MLGGTNDLLVMVQRILIWPYEDAVYTQLESLLENDTQKILWDFEIQEDHQISAWQTDRVIVSKNKQKKTKNKNK